jgi:hypothetical protein
MEIICDPLLISFSWLMIPYDRVIADMNPRFAKLDIFKISVVAASLGFAASTWSDILLHFLLPQQYQIIIHFLCQNVCEITTSCYT